MEESAFDPATSELTTVRTTDAATPSVGVSKFGRPIRRQSLRETGYNYFDPLGRAEYFVVYHPVTDELLYDRWSAFDESDNETDYGLYYYGDDLYVSGSRTFDAFNREVTRTDALGNVVTTTYDPLGRPVATSGATYPTQNSYDTLGRMKTLSTTRDGNLTTNGVWSYAWDAENRLVGAYSNNVCVISNAYDHMGRRVLKVSHEGTETRRFVYDDWNLVQETIQNQQSTITNHYVWGKDLSGTLQGTGGVGGLVAVSLNGSWFFPFYDNNGSITSYIDEQGSLVAEYAYDAFGGTIAKSGSMAYAFAHRFSTKYFDSETGLYYYGYRFYSPDLHRWLNRDPIEEQGGLNLYAFCRNDGAKGVDVLGLSDLTIILGPHINITEKMMIKKPDSSLETLMQFSHGPVLSPRLFVPLLMTSTLVIKIKPPLANVVLTSTGLSVHMQHHCP